MKFASTVLAITLFLALTSAAAAAAPPFASPQDVVIGIDLGTTYSCVGVFQNGRVEIIPNEQGNRVTPSYVAFTENERLIGDAAKNQASLNPNNTVYDAKRLIGRQFSDPSVQQDLQLWPFTVVPTVGDQPRIEVGAAGVAHSFAPEEMSAMLLSRLKETAESFLGHPVSKAVVTVPAYFNDAQKQATKDAGRIAGLDVVRILNEPTAAAIAYGLDKQGGEKNVLVFDLGGGTFDVSLLAIESGVFEVLATSGDTHLGGEDFDNRVIRHMLHLFERKHGLDASADSRAIMKLRREVERAKRALSTQQLVRLEVEGLFQGRDLAESLTRTRFEELNADLFKKTLGPVQRVLADSGVAKADVAEIVLVGGSTRIPKITSLLRDFFNGKEPSRGVNPDEAVAYGAAVQAGILSGAHELQEVVLLDATPLTLGIETAGGVMTKIIERGATIPTKKAQLFSTYQDNQPAVSIKVLEGERALSRDNHVLGTFELNGLPPAPRGTPQIEVTFEIDADGLLHVEAVDKASGKERKIAITNDKSRLTQAEIEAMLAEAATFKDQDREVRQRTEARHELERYIHSMRDALGDGERRLADRLREDDKERIEQALRETDAWLDGEPTSDHAALEEKLAELQALCGPVVQSAYDNGANEPGGFAEEDVEVEYEL